MPRATERRAQSTEQEPELPKTARSAKSMTKGLRSKAKLVKKPSRSSSMCAAAVDCHGAFNSGGVMSMIRALLSSLLASVTPEGRGKLLTAA